MLPAMFVQQKVFAIVKGFDFDKLYIVCEWIVLCTCSIPHQSIVDSIVALLSSFHIFKGEVSQDLEWFHNPKTIKQEPQSNG